MLQALGLSKDADSIYRTLLAQPSFGIAELARSLGLSESRVRQGLDELARCCLTHASAEHPDRLRVVNPEIGLTALLQRQELELAERQRDLAERKTLVLKTINEYAEHSAAAKQVSQRLMGMDAILACLEQLAAEVRFECLSVMPGGAQSKESLDASRPLDQNALDRGVSIVTLYQESVRNEPATYAYARWLTELGGEVRTAPVLPPRMLIFDRQIAVVPLDPSNTKLGALCTREPAVVASLLAIYRQVWERAVPLSAAAEDADCGPSMVERELLRLLATGLTDEAVGNRLGLSARTVRRQMAGLMERLSATSRFEAGLRAAQKGWL